MSEQKLSETLRNDEKLAQPVLRPGNTNCGGCGMSITLQMLRRAMGGREAQLVIPACCGAITGNLFPTSALGLPTVLATFASAAAVASGLANVARINGEKTRTICLAGDGGTYDIGMATLSAAAERNEDILYICYDNEMYGNTGGQRSSATPKGASTTNTLAGKPERKKDIIGIMAAHGIPYTATLSIAHPADMVRKMRLGLDKEGFRFLHVLSPCPTGWKSEPALGVELVRMAVRSGLYPVLEIIDGRQTLINVEPDFSDEALELYLTLQRRFQKSGITADKLRPEIEIHWRELYAKSGRTGQTARNA